MDADGRFVVAVIAPNGSLVAGARMTFTAAAKVPASSQVWETTAKGLVVISGLKPGVYHVAIAAAQGSYQGLLLIRSADPGDKTRQHLVAFTLDCGCTSEVLEGLTCEPTCGVGPQTGRLAAPLLIGAAATATALSLTLGGEQEGPVIPVASP